MHPVYLSQQAIQAFIQSSLLEDIGEGDHSSLGAIPRDKKTQGRLHIKDTGVVAGIELSKWIFKFVDPTLTTTYFVNDGEEIKPGDVAFVVEGNAHSILSAERLILNCMQRMSGIATYTRKLSKLLSRLCRVRGCTR